jgi:hypothetical protein
VSAGAFVDAGALPVGDEVLTAGGARLSVAAVVLHEQDLTAYNLSIESIHTYYAGDAAVLVHNTGAACDLPRDSAGRFMAGAGGESASASAGRSAHEAYSQTLGGGCEFNKRIKGSLMRPDAIDWDNFIVRELKPDRPGAISRGNRQLQR